MSLRGSFRDIMVASVLLFISIGFILILQKETSTLFMTTYEFVGPSGVFYGDNGETFVIDNGKKSVVVINASGQVSKVVKGEKIEKGFYYAAYVTSDSEGNIYVADTVYSEKGTIISAERIVKYDDKGRFIDIIYEVLYEETDHAPVQYGNINSMKMVEDQLMLTYKQNNSIDMIVLSGSGEEISRESCDIGDLAISSIQVDVTTMEPVFITRKGALIRCFSDGSLETILASDETGIPWRLDIVEDVIYYCDLRNKEVRRVDPKGQQEVVLSGEEIIYSLASNEERLLATDYIGIYELSEGETTYFTTVKVSGVWLNVIFITLIAITLIALLYLLINLFIRLKGISKSQSFQNAVIIVTVAMLIATVVIYLSLSTMFRYVDDNVMKDLNLFCEVLVEATDRDALAEIDDIGDYRGEAYTRIKTNLDSIVEASYNNQIYYYYIVYKRDEASIVGVMDYEDTMTTDHPFYTWGENSYTDVFLDKERREFRNDVSAYGTWSFVVHPIMDTDGNVVGIMEVGTNTDAIIKQRNTLLREIIVTVMCSVIILIIVMIEQIFFVHYRERKAGVTDKDDWGYRFPIRNLIFITFLADSMQDAFIPILVSGRYKSLPFITEGVGVALPITAQLFMTAMFSFLGGTIVTKIGVKKTLLQGFLIQMVGYIICAVTTDYFGILLGKTIVGIGMGMIIVVINTIAAVAKGDSGELFGEINAGILAGVTAGVGIGAVLLSRVGYKEVFVVATLMIVFGVVLVLLGDDFYPTKNKKVKAPIDIRQFILNREIMTFLLLMLTPFLIALSYREYFFPLYAQSMGLTESNIGYLYLISGLIVIYLGPSLTKNFIQWFGEKKTVILGSLLMCLVSLIFGIFNSLTAAIVGIFLLSIAISFGYAAQSTYFSSRKATSVYGEGKAMGVYALFDNGGQTIGPIAYGLALTLGYQSGVVMIGSILAVVTILFIVINKGR